MARGSAPMNFAPVSLSIRIFSSGVAPAPFEQATAYKRLPGTEEQFSGTPLAKSSRQNDSREASSALPRA